MNLLNEKVTHNTFGMGKIVDQSESVITINFNEDIKRFIYPDAFRRFISLKDQTIAKSFNKIISEKEKEEEARERKLAEKREQEALEQRRLQLLADHKIHESSQIVFWLDENEQQTVFTEWKVSTGEIQSGPNKGNPNRAARVRPNSAAVLTVRESGQAEEERKIIGLYMVHETFAGDLSDDGLVPTHEEFKIKLTDTEAEKMLFWNYYKNKNNPERMTWNSGKYRYFDNIWTAQMLNDIISLKTNEEEIQEIKDFLAYFIEINLIDENNIPEPNGALKQ